MLKLHFRDHSKPDMWLVDEVITFGSDSSCAIRVDSPVVAPTHAEIHVENETLIFKPVAKGRSSFINGMLIATDYTLKAWDIIKIGDSEFELVDPLLNRSPRYTQGSHATEVRPLLSDWLIQAQTHPFAGQLFPISSAITIGRDTQCDIAVPMQHVSRKHALIFAKNGSLFAKDLSSANGTYVNGKKITEVKLEIDDELSVDEFIFKIIYTGEVDEKRQKSYQTTIQDTQEQVSQEKQRRTTTRYPTPEMITPTAELLDARPAFMHGKSMSVRGKVYDLKPDGNSIGRLLGHHLSREESSVSARHVDIFKKGRFWCIKNNGAANGLLVNGRMCTRATLVDGDEVTVGGVEMIFQCQGDSPRTIVFDDMNKTPMMTKVIVSAVLISVLAIIGYYSF